jgi:hypothetical protein
MRGSVRLELERYIDCHIYVLKTDHTAFLSEEEERAHLSSTFIPFPTLRLLICLLLLTRS